jgi:hypothetical protein
MVVPTDKPLTTPLMLPMVAIPTSLLLQVPPALPFRSVVVAPVQALGVPVMGNIAPIVVVNVAKQVPPVLYVILAVPPATPVTIPSSEPTVAMVVALLLQVPPPTLLLRVVVPPAHILPAPVMAAGVSNIFILVVLKQPVESI